MVYFHPNDFDTGLPTPKELGFIRNRLNTIGTRTSRVKLESFLKLISFMSLKDAADRLQENIQGIVLKKIPVYLT
jgi:hypothetical protein